MSSPVIEICTEMPEYREKGSAHSHRGLSSYAGLGLTREVNISSVRNCGLYIPDTGAACSEAQVSGRAQHVCRMVSGGDDAE